MGTGDAYYDNETKESGRCPHCLIAARFQRVMIGRGAATITVEHRKHDPFSESPSEPSRTFEFFQCPNCNDVIIWMSTWNTCQADRGLERIFPIRSDHPPPPQGTPPHIARAYEEAVRVLPISPNAAAALARRALQTILREVVGAPPGSIYAEIEAARSKLPDWLISGLHHLREVGNFALHPDKDALTGEIIDTYPVEAELTVGLVEALLQHQYAGREAAARLSSLLQVRKSRPKPSN